MPDGWFTNVAGAIGLSVILRVVLPARTVAWRIDSLHSSAQFSVRPIMISTVRGHFGASRER
jgi:polyisoprenoid-binding protein YceI